MRSSISTLAAAVGLAVSLALAGGGASAGSHACPLTSASTGPQYTCAPLPTVTSTTPTDPLPGPIPVPQPVASAQQTHPLVLPRRGRRRTIFRVYGTVRVALGVQGLLQRDYRILVADRAHRGCGSTAQQTLTSGSPGEVFRVALVPPAAGWCRGRLGGTIVLEGGPFCPAPGIGQPPRPCPAFAFRSQTVGRFSLRVR